MIVVTLCNGMEMQIDSDDKALFESRSWSGEKHGNTFYARATVRPRVYFHNEMMGGQSDHRDGDGLNNTRANLRRATQAQNTCNVGPKKGRRFKGTHKHPRATHWHAFCAHGGVRHYSGGHSSEEDAARAYDEMARKHHGDFARLNFPESGE